MISTPLKADCPVWQAIVADPPDADFATRLDAAHVYVDAARTRAITVDDICHCHRTLFEAIAPVSCRYYAGNFRQFNIAMPCLCQNVEVLDKAGKYVGIGEHFMHAKDRMQALCTEAQSALPEIANRFAKAKPAERANIAAKFVSWIVAEAIKIHPFIDGNGRTSRLLWRWGFRYFGVGPQVRTFPRPGGRYEAVMACAMRGDTNPLRKYLLEYLRDCFKPDAATPPPTN